MEIGRMIALYMEYCRSKQLRPKTMLSYEQTIKLFAKWLKEVEGIDQVGQIKEATIRHYILEMQSRGKYVMVMVWIISCPLEDSQLYFKFIRGVVSSAIDHSF